MSAEVVEIDETVAEPAPAAPDEEEDSEEFWAPLDVAGEPPVTWAAVEEPPLDVAAAAFPIMSWEKAADKKIITRTAMIFFMPAAPACLPETAISWLCP